MPHVLLVCTANICRSPVAVALLTQRLKEENLKGWTVSSAGTWAQKGLPASPNSVAVMAERGLDLTDHVSRPVEPVLMEAADLVLCMELGHVEALQTEFPLHAHKVFTLSQMSGPSYSIADPYGGPLLGYIQMAAEIGALLEAGFPRILELARSNASTRATS
jgi:protein-tyrosine-phosphatase